MDAKISCLALIGENQLLAKPRPLSLGDGYNLCYSEWYQCIYLPVGKRNSFLKYMFIPSISDSCLDFCICVVGRSGTY